MKAAVQTAHIYIEAEHQTSGINIEINRERMEEGMTERMETEGMKGAGDGGRLRIALPVFSLPNQNYENALRQLGTEPVLTGGPCDPADYDGLLIPGGDDINPARFGEENRGSEGIDDALDALQFEAIGRFVAAKKPIFGICRGHQVLNVYFGGSLIQDLGEKNAVHRRQNGADNVHGAVAEADSWLGQLYGTHFSTNSAHHQALGRIGDGLRVVSWSEDGVAEALVHETLPIFSVQWHPERMCFAHARTDTVDGSRVLRQFLEVCGGN